MTHTEHTSLRQHVHESILRQFDYATDGVSGVLMAASLADAYRTMRARISDAQIADGATLWVGDKESGERITMSHGETL